MQFSQLLFLLAALLAPLALLSTTWLYLYPIFHGCAFPRPPLSLQHKYPLAPFRLLSLGDPQLEGDSSLPDPNAPVFPSLTYLIPHLENAESNAARIDMLREAGKGVIQDAGKWLEGKRKAVDLWGNDRYLAHIVRMVKWWTEPSHVAVLGDLLGSQWVTDGEFEKRAGRYWGVVMRGLEMVPRRVFGEVDEEISEGVRDVANEDSKVDAVEGLETEGDSAQNTHTVVDEADSQVAKDEEKREELVDKPDENESHDADPVPRESELRMAMEAEEKLQQQIWADNNDDVAQAVEEMNEAKEEDAEASEIANASPTEAEEMQREESQEEAYEENNEDKDDKEEQKAARKPLWGGTTEVLGADNAWKDRVINIAGNHDVGYAGDLDDYRIERFEKAFGSVNWDIWFKLPSESTENDSEGSPSDTSSDETAPALRLVILNSMNLDTPAWNSEMQSETYKFMNHIITSSRSVDDKTHATVLLTHIPLEKQPGICVDSPFFSFYDEGQGVREQNMLSDFSSKTILENIYGMSDNMFAAGEGLGRRGIILNGHDHAGCDVTHFIRQNGVFDACDPRHVNRKDAHWPATPSTSTTTTTSTSTTKSVPTTYETSPANPFIQETSPVPIDSTPSQDDEPPEPEKDPALGWRAHRFPHRPYSITHYPHTNTTSCTSIDRSPHIREITLRSMMGEFSGYAGFLSAWFDPTKGAKGEWVFEFSTCGVGIQHWWWAVHIVDVVLVVLVVSGMAFKAWEGFIAQSASLTPKNHMNGNGQMKRKT